MRLNLHRQCSFKAGVEITGDKIKKIQTADKMTIRQIAAKVREFFTPQLLSMQGLTMSENQANLQPEPPLTEELIHANDTGHWNHKPCILTRL